MNPYCRSDRFPMKPYRYDNGVYSLTCTNPNHVYTTWAELYRPAVRFRTVSVKPRSLGLHELHQQGKIDRFDRARMQDEYGGDILQPWIVKKTYSGHKWVPNPAYIRHYANDPQALNMFTQEDLRNSGV